jgi:hypothetical protein
MGKGRDYGERSEWGEMVKVRKNEKGERVVR